MEAVARLYMVFIAVASLVIVAAITLCIAPFYLIHTLLHTHNSPKL